MKLKHLCARYHIINKDGRLARETNDCKTRDLKTKYNTTCFFSRKFKELFTIYFYCKICAKDVSCSDGGASVLQDSVSLIQSLTKNKSKIGSSLPQIF